MSEVIQAILKAQMAAGDEEKNCLKAHLSAFGGWDGFVKGRSHFRAAGEIIISVTPAEMAINCFYRTSQIGAEMLLNSPP